MGRRERSSFKNLKHGENFVNLFEMKQAREAALAKADAIVTASENGKRALTDAESQICDAEMTQVTALNPNIERVEKINTMRTQCPTGRVITENRENPATRTNRNRPAWLTEEYRAAKSAFLASRGRNMSDVLQSGIDEQGGFKYAGLSAASYEGGATSGLNIVPSFVEQEIVPLAPPIMGIESI